MRAANVWPPTFPKTVGPNREFTIISVFEKERINSKINKQQQIQWKWLQVSPSFLKLRCAFLIIITIVIIIIITPKFLCGVFLILNTPYIDYMEKQYIYMENKNYNYIMAYMAFIVVITIIKNWYHYIIMKCGFLPNSQYTWVISYKCLLTIHKYSSAYIVYSHSAATHWKRHSVGVSWCCGNYRCLTIVLWCEYCSVSFYILCITLFGDRTIRNPIVSKFSPRFGFWTGVAYFRFNFGHFALQNAKYDFLFKYCFK